MMRLGHYASATPVALGLAECTFLMHAPAMVMLAAPPVVVWTSTWNDLDHPRFKGHMHPGAALVRGTGHLGYRLFRTDKDKTRGDVHRGPSHCLEWCVLAGLLVAVALSLMPPMAGVALWFGAAVTLGTASHVLADSLTPSGVPLSALYNYLRYREVWRRHAVGLFSTNSAAERFYVVPVLFLLSGVIGLAMLGLLSPIVSAVFTLGGR